MKFSTYVAGSFIALAPVLFQAYALSLPTAAQALSEKPTWLIESTEVYEGDAISAWLVLPPSYSEMEYVIRLLSPPHSQIWFRSENESCADPPLTPIREARGPSSEGTVLFVCAGPAPIGKLRIGAVVSTTTGDGSPSIVASDPIDTRPQRLIGDLMLAAIGSVIGFFFSYSIMYLQRKQDNHHKEVMARHSLKARVIGAVLPELRINENFLKQYLKNPSTALRMRTSGGGILAQAKITGILDKQDRIALESLIEIYRTFNRFNRLARSNKEAEAKKLAESLLKMITDDLES